MTLPRNHRQVRSLGQNPLQPNFVYRITVLAYHNVVRAGQESPNDPHSISIEKLNEHILALTKAGFRHISLTEAFDMLVENQEQVPSFVLTFDDGYSSLKDYLSEIPTAIAPTVFILTDCLGKSTLSWNTRSSVILKHLDLKGILMLKDSGFDIQLHGTDHHNLLKFSANQLRDRFRKANDWFLHNLDALPEFMAYPYGYCDELVKKITSEFYRGALSINHGSWGGHQARYALNRVGVPYFLKGEDIVSILQVSSELRWYEIESRAPWRKREDD